jgi:hypothetical protein
MSSLMLIQMLNAQVIVFVVCLWAVNKRICNLNIMGSVLKKGGPSCHKIAHRDTPVMQIP